MSAVLVDEVRRHDEADERQDASDNPHRLMPLPIRGVPRLGVGQDLALHAAVDRVILLCVAASMRGRCHQHHDDDGAGGAGGTGHEQTAVELNQ